MSDVIRGEVGDVIKRDEVSHYIVPDGVRFDLHSREEVAMIVPEDRGSHPVDLFQSVPIVGGPIVHFVASLLPRSLAPPPNRCVIGPYNLFEVGETVALEAEPVFSPGVPAAEDGIYTYRFEQFVERGGRV